MFCGCALSFGDEPNVHTCPVCLGHPGTLPTVNEQAVHYGLMIAARARLRGRAALDLRTARTTSIPTCRRATRSASTTSRWRGAGELGGRPHPPRPPRGGRREAHPRRRVGPDPRLRRLARRLQPRRHPAGRDRHRARHPRARRRRASGSAPARDAAPARRLRREHGGGEPALSTRNISLRPAGSEELGDKTELKNMNSFRFLERGIEAELERQRGLLDAGEAVDAGDAPLRPADGLADAAALEGVRPRLPLLPRARPGPAGADRGDDRRRARRAAGAARRRAATATSPSSASPRRPATPARVRRRARATYFERALAAAGDGASPTAIANWVTGDLVAGAARGRRGGATRSRPRRRPRRSRRSPPWSSRRRSPRRRQAGAGELVAEGGDPAAIVEREGLGADRGLRRARGDRRARDRGRARGRREGARRAREGDRPRSSAA